MRNVGWIAIGLAMACGSAQAADYKTLHELQAPPPTALRPFDGTTSLQAVKFARIVIHLRPEPWAQVHLSRPPDEGGETDNLATWKEGQVEFEPSIVAALVEDELKAAHVPVDGSSGSLFVSDSTANLQLGVRIEGLLGRFCLGCKRLGFDHRWR